MGDGSQVGNATISKSSHKNKIRNNQKENKIVKILLSCDSTEYDIALTLQSTFQQQFGYKVFLEVDDWKAQEEQDPMAFEDDFDSKLEGAAVLLVFEFGDSSISAWVMLEDTDKRNLREANPRKSFFPESIDFEKSFSRGIRVFQQILKTDFGLITSQSRNQ